MSSTPEQQPSLRSVKFDFEAMNLQPGTKIQFLTHRGHKPTHFVSTFIGLEQDEYLLIKMPREQGVPVTFHDGEKISIRVFSGTAICAFDATVMKSLGAPLYCLCIGYPARIQIKKLRSEMRVKMGIPVSIRIDGATDAIQAELGNISATGGLIRADTSVGEVDAVVTLSFQLPSKEGPPATIETSAKVRNVLEHDGAPENGLRFSIGTEFIDLGTTQQLMVRNHVYEALLDSRQNAV